MTLNTPSLAHRSTKFKPREVIVITDIVTVTLPELDSLTQYPSTSPPKSPSPSPPSVPPPLQTTTTQETAAPPTPTRQQESPPTSDGTEVFVSESFPPTAASISTYSEVDPTTTSVSTAPPNDVPRVGFIMGIVAGVAVIAILALVVAVVRRRRKKHDMGELCDDESSSAIAPSCAHDPFNPEPPMRSVGHDVHPSISRKPGTAEQAVLVVGRVQWPEEAWETFDQSQEDGHEQAHAGPDSSQTPDPRSVAIVARIIC